MTRTILLTLLLAATPAGTQPALQGQATVIDGDTIEIHGQRIRIHGIDAPESWQACYRPASGTPASGAPKAYRCGQEAAFALADWIERRVVTCVEHSRDRYARIVARCSVAEQDMAAWLVRQGHALDWPRYSSGEYAPHEREAQASRRGIWRGQFQLPWERRRNRDAELVN